MKQRQRQLRRLLKDVDLSSITEAEINSLLLVEHPRLIDAGFVLTAAFNLSDLEDLVVEPVEEFVLRGLGWKLAEGKTLTIKTQTEYAGFAAMGAILNYGSSYHFGFGAQAPIVNYGHVLELGNGAKQPVINFGSAHKLGDEATGAIINYGYTEYIGNRGKPTINCGKVEFIEGTHTINLSETGNQLADYLDELKDKLGPHRSSAEVVAEIRRRDISNEVSKLTEVKK